VVVAVVSVLMSVGTSVPDGLLVSGVTEGMLVSVADGEAVSVSVSVGCASVLAGVDVVVSPDMATATPDKASPTDDIRLPSPVSVELELVESVGLLPSVVELSNVTCLLTTLGK
jgi:hypothetical protein